MVRSLMSNSFYKSGFSFSRPVLLRHFDWFLLFVLDRISNIFDSVIFCHILSPVFASHIVSGEHLHNMRLSLSFSQVGGRVSNLGLSRHLRQVLVYHSVHRLNVNGWDLAEDLLYPGLHLQQFLLANQVNDLLDLFPAGLDVVTAQDLDDLVYVLKLHDAVTVLVHACNDLTDPLQHLAVGDLLETSDCRQEVLDRHQVLLLVLASLSDLAETVDIFPHLGLPGLQSLDDSVGPGEDLVHHSEQTSGALGLLQVLPARALRHLLDL